MTDFTTLIHCENPSAFTLRGTNSFIIGRGSVKTLVDPGDFPEANQEFLANLSSYLSANENVKINRILITHGHRDHFGGLWDTIQLLKQTNRATDDLTAFKHLTEDNPLDEDTFERYPELPAKVQTITDGQIFEVDSDLTLQAFFTPGHCVDHVSFLIA